MNKTLTRFLLTLILCCSNLVVLADTQATDPQQVVEQTTTQILAIIKDTKNNSTKDTKRFNAEVTSILDKVIDFDGFARSVMGTYASNQRFKALTSDTDKALFRERIERFSATFKQGLIDTYMKSLLNFNSEKIETLQLKKGVDLSTGSATVMQNIFNSAGKSYVVQYTMNRNKSGEWKLKNIIIEGINLGLTYRNQFSEAADKYQGDLDKVIANWRVEPEIVNSGAPETENKK